MKSLEIFSGAGGLAKGLELAGFQHSAFVEFNKHACASLYENFEAEKVYFGDIKNFDFNAIGAVDVVAGGPPCQPFSLGGKHKADQDSRDMFPYAIRAIEQLTPKAFVFENVKGLLRASFADYFEYIILRLTYPGFAAKPNADWKEHLSDLRSIGQLSYAGTKYNVTFKLINAANYGVPQTREPRANDSASLRCNASASPGASPSCVRCGGASSRRPCGVRIGTSALAVIASILLVSPVSVTLAGLIAAACDALSPLIQAGRISSLARGGVAAGRLRECAVKGLASGAIGSGMIGAVLPSGSTILTY